MIRNKIIEKVAVIVVSCDNYSDLWDGFIFFYNKYWKNNLFKSYFITNNKEVKDPSFEVIKTGKDISWSKNLKIALNKIKSYEYVILTIEDFYIVNHVNNELLLETISYFIDENGNYLTLIDEPKGDVDHCKYYRKISTESNYRQSATFAIWNRKTLINLLNDYENAWEFEKLGIERSKNFDGFYSVKKSIFSFVNTVVKGKWTWKARIICFLKGFKKSDKRETHGLIETLYDLFYVFLRKIAYKILPKSILKYLRKKISY